MLKNSKFLKFWLFLKMVYSLVVVSLWQGGSVCEGAELGHRLCAW